MCAAGQGHLFDGPGGAAGRGRQHGGTEVHPTPTAHRYQDTHMFTHTNLLKK